MLYLIPTPIGNLEDITMRAVKIIKSCEILICEDPRHTGQLLKLLDIEKPKKLIQLSKNQEINWKDLNQIIDDLEKHKNNQPEFIVGLVCDAGTPGISDPGKMIVQKMWERNLKFTVLPGATSLIPTIVAAGMTTKDWSFKGFLPIKKGRQTFWKDLVESQTATIIFESVHRMERTIEEMKTHLPPNRLVFIAKEISKLHETYLRTSVEMLNVKDIVLKGEFVVVIGGVEDVI
jgi:16S rRNA (cytidine1402-2'-O)-methyltransferase